MLNLFLAVSTTSSLAILALMLWAFRKIFTIKSQIETTISQFVSSPGENKPSPLATTIEAMSHIAGHAISMEVKTTLMGKASVDSRNEKSIIGDIAQDTISNANPLVGAILSSFPTLSKRLARNPQLALMAGDLLSKIGNSKQGNNGSSQESPKFKL